MEEFLKNIIMGIVQGIAEFLPISSSGHLVIFSEFLNLENLEETGMLLNVIVHLGTLISVFIFFRKDIQLMINQIPAIPAFVKRGFKVKDESDENTMLLWYIFLGTLPAAILGLTFKENLESLFTNKFVVLVALLVNALVLWSSKFTIDKQVKINAYFAILIGAGQALAIVPGISRSGTTIVLALWLGVTRSKCASFSFLLSIPVILGASLLEMKSIGNYGLELNQLINMFGAFLAAAISGYLAIRFLTYILHKQKFEYFAYYCIFISICSLIFSFLI